MTPAFRLSSFYFAYFAYAGAFVPYFPLYLAARGLGAGEIALVLALPQVARTFAPGFWGWLADRWRTKRGGAPRAIVVFSCAAIAAGFVALPYAPGFAGIAALVAMMSVLSAGALPLVEAITLGALAGRSGQYGPIRLWGSVGFIATVLAVGAWLDAWPASALPPVFLLLSLAALAAAALLPGAGVARAEPESRSAAAGPAVRALLGAGFCMAAAHGALYAFFTLHLERLGYSGTAIGMLWTLGVLAEIAVFVFLPALFRRCALSAILVASFACAALRFAAIGWGAEYVGILVAAQLLHAATFGAFHAASVAAVQKIFPPWAQARGQALFSSLAYGAGGAAGALLAGWAWEAAGPGPAFGLSSVAALLGGALALRLRREGI